MNENRYEEGRVRVEDIPDHVFVSLARCFLPAIRAFYATEEGRREFAEWKAAQEKEKQAQRKPERQRGNRKKEEMER